MEMDGRIVVGLLILLLAAMIGGAYSLVLSHNEEEKAWLQFRREHHCRIIGEMTGGYRTPPETGWLCDDGRDILEMSSERD